MAIRLSGMNSGLDTDSIVKALVSGYTTKKEKHEKAQTKLGWKQEIWKGLNTKVNSLYKSVGDMRFSSACRHLNHDGLTSLERLSNPLHHVELIIVKLYLIHVDSKYMLSIIPNRSLGLAWILFF